MTVSRFHVRGMDCAAEEQLVRMRLADIDGIDRIVFDLGRREVAIAHRTDVETLDDVLQALDLGTTHLGDGGELDAGGEVEGERSALVIAFLINAGFFIGELTIGLISRSMGLVADALDMGADASVYALSLAAVGSSTARKHGLARTSGHLQLLLAGVGLLEVVRRVISDDGLPDTTAMIVVSALALVGNIVTLVVLQRVRSEEAHFQASWIFTANDIKVNALVIAAAVIVLMTDSAWPDLLAGAIIFIIVANGARRILRLARARVQ